MKKLLFSLSIASFLLIVMMVNAGNGKPSSSCIPYKSPNSVFYATDIIINNDPVQNQRNVHLTIAFNGWLYAVYTNNYGGIAALTILQSTDNGVTWTTLNTKSGTGSYNAVSIVVAGSTLAALKLFVAGVYYDPDQFEYQVWCDRYNGQSGAFEDELFSEQNPSRIYDVAIASDYKFPGIGVNPFSLGIVYSKYGSTTDSIIILTSGDGGNSIGSRQIVSFTGGLFGKVALSYGISQVENTGMYFVAWEEFETSSAKRGHIWTGHTDMTINSPIIDRIMLDSLNPPYTKHCLNPSIATQYSDLSNNTGNLSEVVLFDGDYNNSGDIDLVGAYNLQAVGTGITNWNNLVIANSAAYEMQSDITFDTANFYVTYFDSTDQKLPCLVNNMNLVNPNTWTIISLGYNDTGGLKNPYPKVQVNPVLTKAANVWNSEGTSGNGVSLFDAAYNNYAGISQIHQSDAATLEGAYPNPATTRAKIGFTLNSPAVVTIRLYSMMGQEIDLVTDKSFSQGKNNVVVDVSFLPEGTYIYSFKAGDFTASGRIMIVR
jgi:hypothetical protein